MLPGCSACSVSPGATEDGRELVAVYVPEKRGAPASAALYDVAEVAAAGETGEAEMVKWFEVTQTMQEAGVLRGGEALHPTHTHPTHASTQMPCTSCRPESRTTARRPILT